MRTLILDIGCSKTKFNFYEYDRRIDGMEMVLDTPFLPDKEMITDLKQSFADWVAPKKPDLILPISYSDSIWYLTKDNEIDTIPVHADIEKQKVVPPYFVSGKPKNSELLSMAHQLMYLKNRVGLDNIKTILPTSTFVAAQLTGQEHWNTWDITHASNSGMWDYKNAQWAPHMKPFIEAGLINHNVVYPGTTLHAQPNQKWLVGGHDSVFAVANETPYSTKPYLSFGTWITASVEGWFKKRNKNSQTRFVIAPNGTILEQLCFRAKKNQYEKAIKTTIAFFSKNLPLNTRPRQINVFGGWSRTGESLWKKAEGFELVQKDNDFNSFLHNEAAKYALRHHE